MPRKRSPHPGIVRLPPRPEKYQRAAIRYKDPDSGRARLETIPADLNEAEIRHWVAKRSQDIYLRRIELRDGAPRLTGASLAEAIADYYAAAAIRSTTAEQYGYTTDAFLSWAETARVRSGDDLTLAKLRDFRAHVIRRAPRSPHSVNRDLRTLAAVLGQLRLNGKTPRLSSDAIKDGLQRVRAPIERKPFLDPGEIRALVEALAGRPIRDFVLLLLLSGMRRGEALGLGPAHVRGDTIELRGADTKTARPRTIDLSVSSRLPKLVAAAPFGWTRDTARTELRALRETPGVPEFTWQTLRRTCGTYLACAPGIWGAASVFMTARQLGHSVAIAERHYLGRIKISPEARTLEQAMGLEP